VFGRRHVTYVVARRFLTHWSKHVTIRPRHCQTYFPNLTTQQHTQRRKNTVRHGQEYPGKNVTLTCHFPVSESLRKVRLHFRQINFSLLLRLFFSPLINLQRQQACTTPHTMVRQDWIRHTDLRPLRYHNRGWRPCRRTLKLLQHCICLCLIFICIIPIFRWSYNRLTVIPVMDLMSKWTPIRLPSEIRIAKATIAYDPMNQIYDGALALHDQHNKRYGYEMHILRTPLVKGFANKMLWLQQTIIAELQRNVAERAEWILYAHHSLQPKDHTIV
jgi:hypothetical protein